MTRLTFGERVIGVVGAFIVVLVALVFVVAAAVIADARPEFTPVCSLMADGTDSPSYDEHMAKLTESFGPLDYVGDSKSAGTGYGTLRTESGETVGYRVEEDSDTWDHPSCLSFRDAR